MNLMSFLKIYKKQKTKFFTLNKSFIFLLLGFFVSTYINPIKSGPKANYANPAKIVITKMLIIIQFLSSTRYCISVICYKRKCR